MPYPCVGDVIAFYSPPHPVEIKLRADGGGDETVFKPAVVRPCVVDRQSHGERQRYEVLALAVHCRREENGSKRSGLHTYCMPKSHGDRQCYVLQQSEEDRDEGADMPFHSIQWYHNNFWKSLIGDGNETCLIQTTAEGTKKHTHT